MLPARQLDRRDQDRARAAGLGDAGPVAAKLRWVRKGSLGLAFESALEDEILQPLLAMPAEPVLSNVVPLKRRAAG